MGGISKARLASTYATPGPGQQMGAPTIVVTKDMLTYANGAGPRISRLTVRTAQDGTRKRRANPKGGAGVEAIHPSARSICD